MQLELRYWPKDCLRQVIDDYLRMRAPRLAADTLERDYAIRKDWLLEVLGDLTPVSALDYERIDNAAQDAARILKHVTVKRRLAFLRSALKYASIRGLIAPTSIPAMPPWLVDDSLRSKSFLTLPQHQEFRLALPPGRFRKRADLSMLTGMHTSDLNETTRAMLDPHYHWPDSDVIGRWWRRNTKNANPKKPIKIEPCWIPMEPELRELSIEWLAEPGTPDQLLFGPTNNVPRVFEAAAARVGLPPFRSNLDYRASHANLLLLRGWSWAYVRIVMGHVGEVTAEMVNGHLRAVVAKRPSTLAKHYLRNDASPAHQHG